MPKFAVLVEFLVQANNEKEAEDLVDSYESFIDYDREGLVEVSILGGHNIEEDRKDMPLSDCSKCGGRIYCEDESD